MTKIMIRKPGKSIVDYDEEVGHINAEMDEIEYGENNSDNDIY